MRLLGRIVLWPIIVLAVVFAVVNRAPVALNLWPLPFTITLPVFIALLVTLALGIVIGGVTVWTRGARWRRQARAQTRRIAELEAALERAAPTMPATRPALEPPRGARGSVPATAGGAPPRYRAMLDDE